MKGADTDIGGVVRDARAYQLVLEGKLSARKIIATLEESGIHLDEEPLIPVLDQAPEAGSYSWSSDPNYGVRDSSL